MQKERMNHVDIWKAFGILLVVLGHTWGIPNSLYNFIYSFHMPLFFIISGFLFNVEKYRTHTFKQVFSTRFKSYMIPYLMFAFLNLLLQIPYKLIFQHQLPDANWLIHNIKGILLCYADIENMPNCSPLWFLVCIFLCSVLFWFITKHLNKIQFIIFPACMCISYIIYLLTDYYFPWKLPTVFCGVFFMYIGHLCKKYALLDYICARKWHFIPFVVACLVAFVCSQINTDTVGLSGNSYGNLLLFLVPAIMLSLFVMLVPYNNPLADIKALIWIGKNTLPIMAFNYFMRDFTTECYYLVPGIRNIPIHWTVSFVLTLVGCILASLIWNWLKTLRTPLRLPF